ncbi:hypothetical protein AB834_00025 [PVC group bacterium (ex Bugula neritina AB1)]|nr:hypothetical protein AB834_00025 [PVC group bacterium (ex Bugula neritina AB1)]
MSKKTHKVSKKYILDDYNAENLTVPDRYMKWIDSNYIGEVSAHWLYIGASFVFWSKDIREMAAEHGETERHHLVIMEHLLRNKQKPRFVFLSKVSGLLLGILPSLFGYKTFCMIINIIETSVEDHYNQQINHLKYKDTEPELLAVLQRCCDEEVAHKEDAYKRIYSKKLGLLSSLYFKTIRKIFDLGDKLIDILTYLKEGDS